jgi:WD40 repeat protein
MGAGTRDDRCGRLKSRQTLSGHEDSVYDVCFAPTDNHPASRGRDGPVILWRPDGSIDGRR